MNSRRGSLFALLFLLLGAVSLVAAQSAATCPDIVKAALQATSGACSGIGRNQACYGNFTLQTQFRSDVTPPTFSSIGDLADVGGIQSLKLSSFDASDKSWGVALMKIQANLPDALPGQNVTFVMFGNVEIDNASNPPVTLSLTARSSANVRSSPSTQSQVLTTLKGGATVVVDGRLTDRSWLRVKLPDGSGEGWILASLLQEADDLMTLAVVDPAAPALTFGPMQAFYFKSGLGNTPCAAVPPNGILLQSPINQKVTLMVDGAQLTLGSTVFVQAQPGGFLTVSVIEGNVTVTVNGVTVIIPAGNSARVPLDANGLASGAPEAPQPYDPTALVALPTVLLPIPVSITALATPEATAPVIPATSEATAEATVEATVEATSEVTAEATAAATSFVAVDAVPLAGTWRDALVSRTNNCNLTTNQVFTLHFTVEDNGATIVFNGYPAYKRTAPGIYTGLGQPIVMSDSSTSDITVYMVSPTEAYHVQTSELIAENCSYVETDHWTYVGP